MLTMLRLRDRLGATPPFRGLDLCYGVYDWGGTPSSRELVGKVPYATGEGANRLHYLPGRSVEEARDPAVSPLWAELHDLPPALLTVGTADWLRDDSIFLAGRLAAAGSEVELAVYPDGPHGIESSPTELGRIARERIYQYPARPSRRRLKITCPGSGYRNAGAYTGRTHYSSSAREHEWDAGHGTNSRPPSRTFRRWRCTPAPRVTGPPGRICSPRTPPTSSPNYGQMGGRAAIKKWIVETMTSPPANDMIHFPIEWYMIDEDKGWITCQVWNRMKDPGDGSIHQAYNFTLLKYAGDGLWAYEEDIYDPKHFTSMMVGWFEAKKKLEAAG